ncbi:hypothetical protein Ade02nite_20860 [Paractinoplanes deccanensis]|uniref:Uncharacterized protein n=1 Tax=Paractinoplanes deccanensis TaxID=113561 RepID=A0ABQ3Y0F3_9ACTN|nr:hypothetical protein [Actinoplanes deccanensis]GID73445.1 hypothetical protein Ade02nite_20860 [Actinoplanes deccanensis]
MTAADEIRDAYRSLSGTPGEYVSLVDVRAALMYLDREEVDAGLRELMAAPDVRLEPEPFGHRIGPNEQWAAIRVAGEDLHLIAIGD